MVVLIVLLVLVAGLALWAISLYNGLVGLRLRFRNAFAQIDVQLQRRHDLIPNLVEVSKGYLKHERETLEAVIQARSAAVDAGRKAAANPGDGASLGELARAEATLGGALGRLLVLTENYPDLKANTTMAQLTEELTSTENKVAFSRQAYNDAVLAYNNARERFPAVMVAGALGFQPAALFEVEEAGARRAPKVSFS